jgi:hypothetical protein
MFVSHGNINLMGVEYENTKRIEPTYLQPIWLLSTIGVGFVLEGREGGW